jgi:hypothetical protein
MASNASAVVDAPPAVAGSIDTRHAELVYEWVGAGDETERRRARLLTESVPLSECGELLRILLDGEVVGYLVGQPREYLRMIFVAPKHRGRRIGRCAVADFAAPVIYHVAPECERFWRRCSYQPSADVENEWRSEVYTRTAGK